jgi:hypothetical protein
MMTSITAGYDGSEGREKEVNPPTEVAWTVMYDEKLYSVGGDVYARLICQNSPKEPEQVFGFFRVPNLEYLQWIRERIQTSFP